MTINESDLVRTFVFIVALIFTIIIVFRLHLFEPVLKHHYNHRKKDNRKERETLYGIYNEEDK